MSRFRTPRAPSSPTRFDVVEFLPREFRDAGILIGRDVESSEGYHEIPVPPTVEEASSSSSPNLRVLYGLQAPWLGVSYKFAYETSSAYAFSNRNIIRLVNMNRKNIIIITEALSVLLHIRCNLVVILGQTKCGSSS